MYSTLPKELKRAEALPSKPLCTNVLGGFQGRFLPVTNRSQVFALPAPGLSSASSAQSRANGARGSSPGPAHPWAASSPT